MGVVVPGGFVEQKQIYNLLHLLVQIIVNLIDVVPKRQPQKLGQLLVQGSTIGILISFFVKVPRFRLFIFDLSDLISEGTHFGEVWN